MEAWQVPPLAPGRGRGASHPHSTRYQSQVSCPATQACPWTRVCHWMQAWRTRVSSPEVSHPPSPSHGHWPEAVSQRVLIVRNVRSSTPQILTAGEGAGSSSSLSSSLSTTRRFLAAAFEMRGFLLKGFSSSLLDALTRLPLSLLRTSGTSSSLSLSRTGTRLPMLAGASTAIIAGDGGREGWSDSRFGSEEGVK